MLEGRQVGVGIFLKCAVRIEVVAGVNGVEGFLVRVPRTVVDLLAQVFQFVLRQKFEAPFAAWFQRVVGDLFGEVGDHLAEFVLADECVVGELFYLTADVFCGGIDSAVAFIDKAVDQGGDLLFEGVLFFAGQREVLDLAGNGGDDEVAPFVDGQNPITDIIGGAVVAADGFRLIGEGMDLVPAKCRDRQQDGHGEYQQSPLERYLHRTLRI